MEVFRNHVWRAPQARGYLRGRYRHLIVDGAEEDNPASHEFVGDLLEICQSALILYDRDAGFRRFLGADPESALRLRERCEMHASLENSFVMGAEVSALGAELAAQLGAADRAESEADPRRALIRRRSATIRKW